MATYIDPWGKTLASFQDVNATLGSLRKEKREDENTAYERERQKMLDQSNLATADLARKTGEFKLSQEQQLAPIALQKAQYGLKEAEADQKKKRWATAIDIMYRNSSPSDDPNKRNVNMEQALHQAALAGLDKDELDAMSRMTIGDNFTTLDVNGTTIAMTHKDGVPNFETLHKPDTGLSFSEQMALRLAGKSNTTGIEINPVEREQLLPLAQKIANGEAVPSQFPKRSAAWYKLMNLVVELNPNYDFREADANFGLAKNPSFRQRGITAQALPEILTNMVAAGKEVGFNDVRIVGRMQKLIKGELNDPELTKYMAIRNDSLMEIASVMRMTGVTDKATELEAEAANPTMSPAALDAWLQGQMTSLKPRLDRFEKIIGGKKDTSVPTIKSDADYEKLPSGTEFIDPNGKRRRKP